MLPLPADRLSTPERMVARNAWLPEGRSPGPLISSASGLFPLRFGGTLDDKVVVYTEGAGGGVGLHACDGFIGLVVNDAIESDVAVLNYDVDAVKADRGIVGDASSHEGHAAATGSHGAREGALVGVVFRQGGRGGAAVIDSGADAVVVRRVGKDFDLIVD